MFAPSTLLQCSPDLRGLNPIPEHVPGQPLIDLLLMFLVGRHSILPRVLCYAEALDVLPELNWVGRRWSSPSDSQSHEGMKTQL